MNTEQILINKWRLLPPEKQEEVIDFVLFLEQNYVHKKQSEKIKNLGENDSKLNSLSLSLKGTLIDYKDPYEPVALEDWGVMM